MKTYNDYVEHFDLKARGEGWFDGLCFTLRELFSLIPAAIGHGIDRLLGLKPLIDQVPRRHYMNGPFGLLFGIVPWIIGATTGFLLQNILSIPMELGHQFDRFLKYCTGLEFDKGIASLNSVGLIFEPFYQLYVLITCVPPEHMNSVFGFIFGFIPHFCSHVVNTLSSILVAAVQSNVDATYSRFLPEEPQQATDSQTESVPEQPQQPQQPQQLPKPTRRPLRRSAAAEAQAEENRVRAEQDLDDIAFSSTADVFKILGINRQELLIRDEKGRDEIVNKAYRRKALVAHPDKNGGIDSFFNEVNRSRDILLKPELRNALLQNGI